MQDELILTTLPTLTVHLDEVRQGMRININWWDKASKFHGTPLTLKLRDGLEIWAQDVLVKVIRIDEDMVSHLKGEF